MRTTIAIIREKVKTINWCWRKHGKFDLHHVNVQIDKEGRCDGIVVYDGNVFIGRLGGNRRREGKPFTWGMAGGVALVLYGIIATFQTFPSFGRVYAAYGGVFIPH